MRRPALNRTILPGLLLVLVAALLLTASLAGAEGTKIVVKAGGNPAADDAYLTNVKGRTLYTLSNERGKFVCKGACLQSWPPLTVPAGTKPVGPVGLGMVKRPDGRWQVTRKGLPLYTYAGDTKKGDTNGEGLKTGGGTWHVSRIAAQAPQPQPSPAPQPPTNPYGY